MKLWKVTWTGLDDITIVHAANKDDALRVAGVTPNHLKKDYAIEEIPTSEEPSVVFEHFGHDPISPRD